MKTPTWSFHCRSWIFHCQSWTFRCLSWVFHSRTVSQFYHFPLELAMRFADPYIFDGAEFNVHARLTKKLDENTIFTVVCWWMATFPYWHACFSSMHSMRAVMTHVLSLKKYGITWEQKLVAGENKFSKMVFEKLPICIVGSYWPQTYQTCPKGRFPHFLWFHSQEGASMSALACVMMPQTLCWQNAGQTARCCWDNTCSCRRKTWFQRLFSKSPIGPSLWAPKKTYCRKKLED